jgi:hypothetical protein
LQKDIDTPTDSKFTSKKTGWKLRSPLARRSPPKENPAQAAEIEKLRRALKDHESATPHEELDAVEVESLKTEIQRLEGYKAAATRLAQEKLESQPKLRALEEENKNLKDEKHRLEPLTQVGVAVRCRFFETYKRETDPKSKEDATIIRNGNGESSFFFSELFRALKQFEWLRVPVLAALTYLHLLDLLEHLGPLLLNNC